MPAYRFFLAALVLTLTATLVSCGGGSGSPDRDQPGVVVATIAPTRPAGGVVSPGATPSGTASAVGGDIAGVADAYAKAKSYRATVLLEPQVGVRQEVKVESVMPDKYHVTFVPPPGGSTGTGGLELIAIGNDTYTKLGANWTRNPGVAGSAGTPFDVKSIASGVQNFRNAQNVTKGSTASVGGRNCQVYTYSSSGAAQEMCIADNLPLRIISTTGGTRTTITFTDWNANFDIKAPI